MKHPIHLLQGMVIGLCLLMQPVSAQDLARELAHLDRSEPGSFKEAMAELGTQAEAASQLALADFSEQPYLARRARAQLLRELGGAAQLPAALALAGDPDPHVRRLLAEFLGELRLADARAAERLARLTQLAESDPLRYVRRAALASLKKASLPGTGAALDGILTRVDAEFGVAIAKVLASLPGARQRLAKRVQEAFEPDSSSQLSSAVLAQLFGGYGAALAELPGGGASARERAPLVLGMVHPSVLVQRAAMQARERCFLRLFALGEYDRAERLCFDLGHDGLARHLLLYRGIKIDLSGRGDAQAAFQKAQALIQASSLSPAPKRAWFRVYGLHYSGLARFAAGQPAQALPFFERASAALRDLLGERLDLRGPAATSGASRLRSSAGGAVMVERLHLYASEQLWMALCSLASDTGGANETPPTEVFEKVYAAHVAWLEARILDMQSDAGNDVSGLDSLFERDFSFEGLVLFNRKLKAFEPRESERLLIRFGRVCASVMPWEFPGFEPYAGLARRLSDPLYDRIRMGLYQKYRGEEFSSIHRQLNQIQEQSILLGAAGDQEALTRQLRLRLRWKGLEEQEEVRKRAELTQGGVDDPSPEQLLGAYSGLVSLQTPSLLGLRMGIQLRADGLPEEARSLAKAVLGDLTEGLPGANTVWVEWASSRLEEMLGSTLMDEGRPLEAEQVLLKAVRRLEALENTLEGRGAGLTQVRRQRANVLLSLAVNANVRMQDAERALGYFEKAFELDQRDFMQILRACYRARSGHIEEARGVLRSVTPTPQLFYNLACTYALLGDTDKALDFLQQELEVNHPVPGALKRQQIWAAEDPDLESLRGNPRFQRLTRTE